MWKIIFKVLGTINFINIREKIYGTFNIVSIFPLFPKECRNRFKHPDEITGSEGSMYLIISTAVFQSCNLAAKGKFSLQEIY